MKCPHCGFDPDVGCRSAMPYEFDPFGWHPAGYFVFNVADVPRFNPEHPFFEQLPKPQLGEDE